jgi:hypothetical protein
MTLRRRDWARAFAITLVLVLQLLDAVPLPELREHHLANPVAQQELRRWSAVLTDAGVAVTPKELAEVGLQLGSVATTFREAVLKPWYPFRRLTGTGQSWGLFAYPEPATGRLVVEGTGPSGTTEFYRAPGGNNDSLEHILEYRRVRGVYDDASDRPKPRKVYRRFGEWMAVRLMTENPELTVVQTRLDRHLIRTPDDGPPLPDTRRHAQSFTRKNLERDGLLEPRP